jgi:uncharacterized ferritin-like protein (DUF455 family)
MQNQTLAEKFFYSANVIEKIDQIESTVTEVLQYATPMHFNKPLLRDIMICSPQELPAKSGLSLADGQARLMHDLASIELQACEVMLRTLIEFPIAPVEFRETLGQMIIEEASHLKICLDCLTELNFHWGHWPVHICLWESLTNNDSLIDRMVIIHRYLEGSGLDAGAQILKRLNGVHAPNIYKGVNTIFKDEIKHVQFGSDWYRALCKQEGLDPNTDFPIRMEKLSSQLPKRLEKINRQLRIAAGFNNEELSYLENRRLKQLGKLPN